MSTTYRTTSCLVALSAVMLAAVASADEGTDFFEKQIRPVLVTHCYKCHSAEAARTGKLKGGLVLDNRDGIRRGGDSGPAVVPGDLKKSLLLSALRHEDLEMPPKGKLPDAVIADFAKWIGLGAPDPRDGQDVVQQTMDLEKGREFWCFQPVTKSTPPKAKDPAWSATGVDRFVAAGLKKNGLQAVSEATAGTLVRRLFFDLLGLPPSLDQLEEWTTRLESARGDDRQKVLGELVDRLLDSPHFGERWGRHWLDVARYAESNGNTRNATFPHAWRYRDYVIDAVNADIPYDRFIAEQIAGDLLPAEGAEQSNRNLVATGFLALASKPVIRGKQAGGFIPDIVADQIEVTSRAILGLTVACARCHDHKFDPIPTVDYYGLAGIFASSQTLYGGGRGNMGGAPTTPLHVLASKDPAKQQAYEEWRVAVTQLAKRQGPLNAKLKKLRGELNQAKKAGDDEKLSGLQKHVQQLTQQRQQVAAELKQLRANPVEPPGQAMGIRDAAKVVEVPIYVRGESPNVQPVSRRFVSVVNPGDLSELSADESGRLALASWLGSSQNPLTARVMVNRIWLHLFGEGLVRTPDNFGMNGERPSHPELLDYLAATFMEDGWSVKKMIRRLTLTQTYQLSDEFDQRNYQQDPDNIQLWRHARRRLEGEAIRDAMLAISGVLKEQRPQGSVVTVHRGQLIQDALTPDKIHKPSRHRSVYLPMLRNGLPEILELFDMADPSLVVGRRNVTTVPSQDLYFLNNAFVVEQAEIFADRVLQVGGSPQESVEAAYRLAVSRPPTTEETIRALEFIEQLNQAEEETVGNDNIGWTSFCQALFASAEFRYLR